MKTSKLVVTSALAVIVSLSTLAAFLRAADKDEHAGHHEHVEFSIQSVRDGDWSDSKTWEPQRVPQTGDRVLVSRGTHVRYNVAKKDVIRLIQIVGALQFARDRDTELNVGLLKVQNSPHCSESGFACDFAHVNPVGEPTTVPEGAMPLLEIGTPDAPIPAEYTARIRLHFLEGMNKDDAPAVACCSAQMELHGSPLSRAWIKLAKDVAPSDSVVSLLEEPIGWKVGDEVIVTGSRHKSDGVEHHDTEPRHIAKIDGTTLTLDKPLEREHFGSGEFRSEAGNLSRNVIVESADPDGVRGHTVYHWGSRGSISYARFAHLGKRGTLGRYPIHFHLVGDTMRGSSVVGVVVVDSHNRWITVHGTNYMLIRDCIGYQGVGHGFFLEDGTEVYNVFDRNLGVQARSAQRLPKQVLEWDPNDGAAFWWANGRNTFVRNTACENLDYGYRFDSQQTSAFDSNLPVLMPDGEEKIVDIRMLPIFRFEDNESHTEGLYAMRFSTSHRACPDTQHPHVLRKLKIWETHYALRSQIPTMLIEDVTINRAEYGIYHPALENHVYRNLRLSHVGSEPFNRGYDDGSTQYGTIAVDGVTFSGFRQNGIPLIQISDNNPSGKAESHFRNVKLEDRADDSRRALVDRGGGSVVAPTTPSSVPVYIHDYFGSGRHAKIVSTAAQDFDANDSRFREERPLTGRDSRVAEVANIGFPQVLDPVDDLPPASIIVYPANGATVQAKDGALFVRGATTDNGRTKRVVVNGVEAEDVDYNFHAWQARLSGVKPGPIKITAYGEDAAGNKEITAHSITVTVK
jgi:hypothetical protein